MPTTLVRHSITETAQIAEAIDTGAAAMPGVSRAEVVRRLITRGAQAVRTDEEVRKAVLDKWAGCLTDTIPQDAAEKLKDEWPN
ncbi:MAG: hypothetical protein FWG15_03795 [Propionibacteriaceae bacterium]|jgi:hypothetical protein|nr:hypothetical protein [Propionibacteriaceae bacterium]